ncbi:MAG: hypothetical protein VX949_09575 [Planctomycetota bacterium]|nr:hypothetical protein [Planctomycetota bacterium]
MIKVLLTTAIVLMLAMIFSGSIPVVSGLNPVAVAADDDEPTDDTDEAHEAHEALEKVMDAVKGGDRAVRRAMRKQDHSTALKSVNRVQAAVIEAKKLVPSAAFSLEGEERAALELEFRQRLIGVLEQWILFEKALLLGKVEEASEVLKKISALKKSAHEKFDVED